MKADPFVQLRLLDLQAIDTGLTQLAHRRRTLPENAELERLDAELRKMAAEHTQAQTEVDDLDRDIRRFEQDIEQVRQRAQRNKDRLDAGKGPAKELEAIQHELVSLGRRQSELEDSELEIMERREAAQAVADSAAERVGKAKAAMEAVSLRRDRELAEITAQEEKRRADREGASANLPGDLITLYEKIRDASGGIGAAALRARRCEGCRLELSGGDLARVRAAAPDDVMRCEECRRILVRTGESGL